MNNYQKQLQDIRELKGKPKLLIHVCCGVCSVYPLKYLRQYFDVTIYFTNSNIYPYEEYQKRLKTLEEYLDILNDKNIKLIIAPYNNTEFTKELSRYKDDKEGQRRCVLCYSKRMLETALYAKKHHYDYFTTVMSISDHKNADYLNQIGEKLEKDLKIKYLHADFKKGDGITINGKMNKELNLYHQDYCGCIYSKTK